MRSRHGWIHPAICMRWYRRFCMDSKHRWATQIGDSSSINSLRICRSDWSPCTISKLKDKHDNYGRTEQTGIWSNHVGMMMIQLTLFYTKKEKKEEKRKKNKRRRRNIFRIHSRVTRMVHILCTMETIEYCTHAQFTHSSIDDGILNETQLHILHPTIFSRIFSFI